MRRSKLQIVLKFLVVLSTMAAISYYHQSIPPLQTFAQIEFEQWLETARTKDGTPRKKMPWVSLKLNVVGEEGGSYHVHVDKEGSIFEQRRDAIRLLELISERKFLNQFRHKLSEADLFSVLEIRREGGVQRLYLPIDHVRSDIKTQTFIRLFQLFAEKTRGYEEIREMMATSRTKSEGKNGEVSDEKS